MIVDTTKIGTVYKGKEEHRNIIFSRVWAMPNHQTFKIGPIAKLLTRYVPSSKMNRWIDPFAGANSPAEITNDHNPQMPTQYHVEAIDFAKMLKGKFPGVLFDPPYSFRQVSEHYKVMGMKATRADTSMAFYEKAKSALCKLIKQGGSPSASDGTATDSERREGLKLWK